MNFYKKASLVAASVALTVSPVAASAAQSAKGVLAAEYAQARTDAETAEENDLRGRAGPGALIIGLLAIAAIIAAIIIAADGTDNSPTSP